jgi:positive regulator of sigma E activity
MIEKGHVVRIEGDRIIVELDHKGGCAHCSINHCCTSTITPKRQLNLKHPGSPLKPGDWVEIETPARSLLSAALLVFILPLIISTAVYIAVMNLSNHSGLALLSFFASFVFSIGFVAVIDRTIGKSRFFEPVIIRKTVKEYTVIPTCRDDDQ